MSTGDRRPLAEMRAVAEEIVAWLAPVCERIEIAGSIRREQAEVGDIEIVCIPKIVETEFNLFGEGTDTRNLLDEEIAHDMGRFDSGEGHVGPRLDKNGKAAIGTRYKRLLYWQHVEVATPVALDLFSVLDPACWGVVFAIRTGPAEFSQRLVTQKAKGGLLPDHMYVKNGLLWSTAGSYQAPGMAAVTPGAILIPGEYEFVEPEGLSAWGVQTPDHQPLDERAFFAAIGVPFLPPAERSG